MTKRYDVVLLGFRADAAERPEEALARIVGITPEEGEALARNAPRPVFSDVGYADAEAYAASLGLAGAEVTVIEHPFAAHVAAEAGLAEAVPLSLRSTRPAPEPSTALVLASEPAVEHKPIPSLPYRSTEMDVVSPSTEARTATPDGPGGAAAAEHDGGPAERMGVLSIPPPRPPQRLRYAGLAMLVAAAYGIWVYFLERL